VRGQADDGVGTEDPPGQRDRGIVLPDMDPVSPDGQREVRAVVEHEGDTRVAADVAHQSGPGQQRAGVQLLVP
jgi:hypothetical protein